MRLTEVCPKVSDDIPALTTFYPGTSSLHHDLPHCVCTPQDNFHQLEAPSRSRLPPPGTTIRVEGRLSMTPGLRRNVSFVTRMEVVSQRGNHSPRVACPEVLPAGLTTTLGIQCRRVKTPRRFCNSAPHSVRFSVKSWESWDVRKIRDCRPSGAQ
ncbi:hypothetical protein BR93DRAFT_214656 [Coniochaeta sp. PMI_546]|nr:hypothetical protein BR93DRAFT_214656 [Coniochaeta sp. PMI_546]